jgi:hypothetical protein
MYDYDDKFTQETVWEQLRFMGWLTFAILGVIGTILSVAL